MAELHGMIARYREGSAIGRAGWRACGLCLELRDAGRGMAQALIATRDGLLIPCAEADLFADDWEVLDG